MRCTGFEPALKSVLETAPEPLGPSTASSDQLSTWSSNELKVSEQKSIRGRVDSDGRLLVSFVWLRKHFVLCQ